MQGEQSCCCGSGLAFIRCCKPYLDRVQVPDTAVQLMRSRYSAFCHHRSDYLYDTVHESKRSNSLVNELESHFKQIQWLSLTVLNEKDGRPGQTGGSIEFVAFFRQNAQYFQLHEESRFIRQEGHWFYEQGVFLPAVKLGRNAPCWCGSGKKLKQCHGVTPPCPS